VLTGCRWPPSISRDFKDFAGYHGLAARAVACNTLTHRGQRAVSAAAGQQARLPGFQARERLSRRVPSPVAAPEMRPHHFVAERPGWASTAGPVLHMGQQILVRHAPWPAVPPDPRGVRFR
jgi:hypothetical protein